MRNRTLLPFWTSLSSKGARFSKAIDDFIETIGDAEFYRDKNLKTLDRCDGLVGLADDIRNCSDDEPCERILCPFCARFYRKWFAAEALHWHTLSVKKGLSADLLVVRLLQVTDEELPGVSISRLNNLLRKRLVRAGIRRVIGGTEASFDPKTEWWTLHFHLLVLDASKKELSDFKASCAKDKILRFYSRADVEDPVEQLTYIQKYLTAYRAGKPDFRGKGKLFPLKRPQLEPLGLLTDAANFEDFLFLVGFRRYANRIVSAYRSK
jgi:hypothetical protein